MLQKASQEKSDRGEKRLMSVRRLQPVSPLCTEQIYVHTTCPTAGSHCNLTLPLGCRVAQIWLWLIMHCIMNADAIIQAIYTWRKPWVRHLLDYKCEYLQFSRRPVQNFSSLVGIPDARLSSSHTHKGPSFRQTGGQYEGWDRCESHFKEPRCKWLTWLSLTLAVFYKVG